MRTRRGVNPLWARSPLLLRRFPALLVGVLAGTLLLAVAAASSPLFLSAAAGSALRNSLSDVTAYGAGLEVKKSDFFAPRGEGFFGEGLDADRLATRDQALDRLVGDVDHLAAPVRTILAQPMQISKAGAPQSQRPIRVLSRTGAVDHVHKLRGSGPGAWVSDAWAAELGLKPGDTIVVLNTTSFSNETKRARVRVAGVYRGLYQQPEAPYWRNLYEQIYPKQVKDPPPPSFLILDRAQAISVNEKLGPERVELRWEYPFAAGDVTLVQAKTIQAGLERVQNRLTDGNFREARAFGCAGGQGYGFDCETITSLDTAIGTAEQEVSALRGPADLLATAGTLVALAVVAAAGAFLVARRRTEAVLLHARGMSPWALAGKTAVETFVPALAGTVLGFGIAVGTIVVIGPAAPLDPGAILDAAAAAALRLPAALAVLAVVAALVFLRLSEHGRNRAGLLRFVPWELALLVAAGFCLERLASGHGLVEEAGGVARPSSYVLLFPIFFVAGLAGLVARIWGPVLRSLRRRSERFATGPYLAVHRLASAERLAVLLVAASALSLGIFVYAQTVVRSLQRSVVAKSELFVGSDVQGTINNDQAPPVRFPLPITKVTKVIRGGESTAGGMQVDLMGVDPRTLARAAFWDSSWSSRSFDEIAAALASPSRAGPVPIALAGGSLPDETRIWVGGKPVPIEIVARASAFPGLFRTRPLVVASFSAWDRAFDAVGISSPFSSPSAESQLWVKGDETRATAALNALPGRPFQILTASAIRDNPSIVAATRTFGFLKSLGFAAGLLAVVGMLLYLQARQRSRVVSYVLSRRMGLVGRGHLLALVLELGAMLLTSLLIGGVLALVAARVILGDVDPLADIPPDPLFRAPVSLIAGAAVGLLPISVLGGLLASRSADRANFAEVMRIAD